jgi:hypothetical protein
MPYDDPRDADGTDEEQAAYAHCSALIAHELWHVLAELQPEVDQKTTTSRPPRAPSRTAPPPAKGWQKSRLDKMGCQSSEAEPQQKLQPASCGQEDDVRKRRSGWWRLCPG